MHLHSSRPTYTVAFSWLISGLAALTCLAGVFAWLAVDRPQSEPTSRGAVVAFTDDLIKGKGPKPYEKPAEAQEFFVSQRIPAGHTALPTDRYEEALQDIRFRQDLQRQAAEASGGPRAASFVWNNIGPGNIGGRTREILIDPTNTSVMYAAAVSGGVWKTTNAGTEWTASDDFMVNLAVNSMALDPSDSSRIYAGTGEGFFNGDAVRGNGIFLTEDAGASWTQIPFTADNADFYYVNELAIDPSTSGSTLRIFAATRTGLWRSENAGDTWTLQEAGTGASSVGCTDVAIRTDISPVHVFAAFGSFTSDGLYRSTNKGDSFTPVTGGFPTGDDAQGRIELAIAPSDQNRVYACVAESDVVFEAGRLYGIYRSDDGGDTWSQVADLGYSLNLHLLSNILIAECYESPSYHQGWYDNVIAVDPLDPDIVWVGGIDLFRSDDAGERFDVASYWFLPPDDPTAGFAYAHADHHAITFHPDYNGTSNQTMYVGGDGGIFFTGNSRAATTPEACPDFVSDLPDIIWSGVNNSYGATQFYHGDVAKTADRYAGGTQDNGTNMVVSDTAPNNWNEILGGDGGYTQFDPTNANVIYAEYTGLSIQKSVNGGASFASASNGIDPFEFSLFIVPFTLDQSDPNTLWLGAERPYRTRNGAGQWTAAGPNFASAFRISAIAIAPSDSDVVYVGYDNGYVARTDNGLDAGTPTWELFDGANGLSTVPMFTSGAFVSSVAVDPEDPDVAYCTYSSFGIGHVRKTINGGQTWTTIDGTGGASIPDIPCHWIAVRPCLGSQLFVGTDLGVFLSEDGGNTWSPANAGLANTVVENLVFKDDDTLVAFTHGRGCFKTTLNACDDCNGNGVSDGTEPDDDGDGRIDDCDNCPNLPNPDQLDTDADGFGNSCDGCPSDPAKVAPGECDCGQVEDPTDTDSDGSPDCNDDCPFDPLKSESGWCGCHRPEDPTNSDSDIYPDCADFCPLDGEKVFPGVCGCGSTDGDSDGDGVDDCMENCPDDPYKREPGVCGCGVNDWDSDGDDIPDRCTDDCPLDPGKSLPGICGCGRSDADTDGDGVAGCNDNCPGKFNPDQADRDRDRAGDACDSTPTGPQLAVPSGSENTAADEPAAAQPAAPAPAWCAAGILPTISLTLLALSASKFRRRKYLWR